MILYFLNESDALGIANKPLSRTSMHDKRYFAFECKAGELFCIIANLDKNTTTLCDFIEDEQRKARSADVLAGLVDALSLAVLQLLPTTMPRFAQVLFDYLVRQICDSARYATESEMQSAFMAAIRTAIIKLSEWATELYSNAAEATQMLANQHIQLKVMRDMDGKYINTFEVQNDDFRSLLVLLYSRICSQQEKKLCRCKNCGRLFVPTVRNVELYCDHVQSNGKKCSEVGFENTCDAYYSAYRTAYKTKSAYKNRNKVNHIGIQKAFDMWVKKAKSMLDDVRAGRITQADYTAFLKSKL